MTRSSASTTYDDDFFAWTQEQAAALRALPPGAVGNDVDLAHLAVEIEDMGKRDLREVESYLDLVFEHLLKVDFSPGSTALRYWRSEILLFQNRATKAYSPSMRRLIRLDDAWDEGRRRAYADFANADAHIAPPPTCPFTLDELLAKDFDVDAALAKIAAAPAA